MTTIVLSAAGAALGGSIGGTLAGVSSAAIGQALGAAIGQSVDQQLLGKGSEPVHKGQVDRFRLTQSAEGTAIPLTFGRTRVGGQVIWSTRFLETTTTTGGGGKGAPPQPKTIEYSYSVSLAVALCEGEIAHVSRVWANGTEISLLDLNMTVHSGAMDQLPDPLMEAVEGAGNVPAYRGTAYVVMENIDLGQFGNRVPQFSFEIVRPDRQGRCDDPRDRGICPVARRRVLSGRAGEFLGREREPPLGRHGFLCLAQGLPWRSAVGRDRIACRVVVRRRPALRVLPGETQGGKQHD